MIPTAQYPLGIPLPVTHERDEDPDLQVLLLPACIGWQRSGIGSAVSSRPCPKVRKMSVGLLCL
jgi:hypothetical protein